MITDKGEGGEGKERYIERRNEREREREGGGKNYDNESISNSIYLTDI